MFRKILIGIFMIVALISMAAAKVNINTASQAELETLPGVGPAKAKAIIDYRKTKGNFKRVDDLKSIPGFGEKLMVQIRPIATAEDIELTPSTTSNKANKKAKK